MMNKLYFTIVLSVFLSGCELTRSPLGPDEIKASLQDEITNMDSKDADWSVPDDVNAELLPDLQNGFDAGTIDSRIDVQANRIAAKQFFGSLLKGSKYNLVMTPTVNGRISVLLNDVTITEAMDTVADMYGYDIKLQNGTYKVDGAGLRTEVIPMNYLMMKRGGSSNSKISSGYLSNSSSSSSDSDSDSDDDSDSGSNSGGTQISTTMDTDYWTELEKTLTRLTENQDDTQVIVSPQSGLVTVHGYPKDIRKIREYLAQSERQLQRQVLLEVKVMEVSLNDGYEQGIDWNMNTPDVDADSSFDFNISDITDIASGKSVLTLASGDFSAAISLLKQQGDVNVLSSPRVTALNNQKAVIKVGKDEYFVTDYSTTTNTETNTTEQDITLTPFFSGIALDVTPQIDDEGGVLLHVHPSIVDVKDSIKTISGGATNITLPLALSDVRETDTVVKAKSGEIVVIGGLMKSSNKDLVAKVPFLGDIPWLGELFTRRSKSAVKTELIILIKPIVVDQNTWRLELERSAELLEKWYPTESDSSNKG